MNSIIGINLGEDNSMNSLSFIWKAKFNDGSNIYQFDDNGIEHKFQEVKDRFDDLKEFSIYNKEKFINYTIDIEKGIIKNNKINYSKEDLKVQKENIRLIYFRRIQKIYSEEGKLLKTIIRYFLGYQYNDKLGNNRQVVLEIDEQGNWILGE